MSDGTPEAGDEVDILELFARMDDDAAARDAIAIRFQPLVEYLARRFAGRGEPQEDLIQVANVGLMNAIDRFDVERGVQFSTYAAATMIGELKRHFRDKGWAIRVPRQLQETTLRLNRALPVMTQELGRSPTIGELAARLEIGEDQIVESMEAAQAYSTSSLDAPASETGLTPAETMGDEDRHARSVGGMGGGGACDALIARAGAPGAVPQVLPRHDSVGDRGGDRRLPDACLADPPADARAAPGGVSCRGGMRECRPGPAGTRPVRRARRC